MGILVRKYENRDLPEMREIWNSVVEEGISFPQTDPMDEQEAKLFFAEQSFTAVAADGGTVVGLYILHLNNIGRCGHIANASYAVKAGQRGRHVGEALVKHSLKTAAALAFKLMQFNAVVATNTGAVHLYKKLGFQQLGTVPKGFRLKDNTYADILLFYIGLEDAGRA